VTRPVLPDSGLTVACGAGNKAAVEAHVSCDAENIAALGCAL